MTKTLLLLSLSTGSGHVRAAEAIEKTAATYAPHLSVTHIDIYDYISLPFQRTTVDGYDFLIKQAPEIWGFLYHQSDDQERSHKFYTYTKRIKRLNAKKLYQFIDKLSPNYIISTHLLASDLVVVGREVCHCRPPLATVVTDYRRHELWFVPGTNHYFVPTEEMREELLHRNLSPDMVTTSGIPVDPVFYEKQNAEKNDKKTSSSILSILVLSGGWGVDKSDAIVRALFRLPTNPTFSSSRWRIVVIAGKNKKLEKKLRAIQAPAHIELEVVGWTKQIHAYMRRADIIVSKPGGMTTTECLVLGKPLVAMYPIPGQEEANADYLTRQGGGLSVDSTDSLLRAISILIDRPSHDRTPWTRRPAAETILDVIQTETR